MIKVLLIDGQNNHNWVETSPVIKEILEKTGRFEVVISTCPPKLPEKPGIKNEDMEDPAMLAAWQEEVKL